MARIILERRFDPDTGREIFERAARELERCLETYRIRPIRSMVARDFSRAVCEFEAPDADTVRAALRRHGIAFERVWKAREIDWETADARALFE